MAACDEASVDIVKMLIKYGANINAKNDEWGNSTSFCQ